MFRYCILASDSVATRHIIMLNEKLPEIAFAITKDAEVMGEAATTVLTTSSGMSEIFETH